MGHPRDIGRRTGMQMTVMALGLIHFFFLKKMPRSDDSIGALAGPPISGIIKEKHSTFHEVGIYAGEYFAVNPVAFRISKVTLAS